MNPINEETHPFAIFKFCPKCGSDKFHIQTFKSKKCDNCQFHYFYNAAAASTVIIRNEQNEILVGKRVFNPAKGTLDLPGGFVDFGENAETAARREIEEEVGIKIDESKLKYLFSLPNEYVYSGFQISTMDLFFEYYVNKNEIILDGKDDIEHVQWIAIDKLDYTLFGLKSISLCVKKYIEMQIK